MAVQGRSRFAVELQRLRAANPNTVACGGKRAVAGAAVTR